MCLVDAHIPPMVAAARLHPMRMRRPPAILVRAPLVLNVARAFRMIFVFVLQRQPRADREIAARARSWRLPRTEEDVGLGVDLMFFRYLYPARTHAYTNTALTQSRKLGAGTA